MFYKHHDVLLVVHDVSQVVHNFTMFQIVSNCFMMLKCYECFMSNTSKWAG